MTLDRDQLAKVLAMLASPHPGEVHAAAQAAVRFLNAADTTWHEVLVPKEPKPQELLEEKIHVLRESNRRLRSENRRLYIRAGIRSFGPLVRSFLPWIAFLMLIELFVYMIIEESF
jgi:hypothetical protein